MAVRQLADRFVPAAALAARAVRIYAIATGVAALIVALYLFRNGLPDEGSGWLGVLLAIGLAAAPPVILFLLSEALRALSELPGRIRDLPATGRDHASGLGRLAAEAAATRGRRGLVRLPLLLWRLARLSGETRGLLTPYAPVLPLVSIPFLVLAAASVVAAAVELLVALGLLVALAAS